MDIDATAQTLRSLFSAAGYTADGVLEAITDDGQNGLLRNSSIPARRILAERDDDLATLIRLFLLGDEVDTLPRALAELDGIIEETATGFRALVDIRPYGSPDDGADGWLVSDHASNMDGCVEPMRPDYVLGASPASAQLAQITLRTPVGSALDLGCGGGVQSLHLAKHAERVVATDLNPRAAEMARLTLALNQVEADIRVGSLFEPVAGERFDLIVTNPPFVMSPPSGERLVYRESPFEGDGLVEQVIRQGADHLNPGGVLQVLFNWAVTVDPDDDVRVERPLAWVPADCDALVVERERIDVYTYVEIWLTDGGWAGSPEWKRKYEEWLRYFEELGITAISMGWITVRRREDGQPGTHLAESWPHQIHQPVASAIQAELDGLDAVRGDDAVLAATHWVLDPGVIKETDGRPGAEHPTHIVYRQHAGMGRAVLADTALAAVLDTCDGELPLGVIQDAVAQILELDAEDVRAQQCERVRELVRQGVLRRA